VKGSASAEHILNKGGIIMQAEGFWITDKGNIIKMTSKHIDYILENPEIFDFTLQGLELTYRKHNEKLGTEGNAREEIIIDVIKRKNWIRVRHYSGKPDYWSFGINVLDSRVKAILKSFINKALGGEEYFERKYSIHSEAVIEEFGLGKTHRGITFEMILRDEY
jgi:hypothetical protein